MGATLWFGVLDTPCGIRCASNRGLEGGLGWVRGGSRSGPGQVQVGSGAGPEQVWGGSEVGP